MKLKAKLLFVLLIISVSTFGQNSVNVIPHWKKNDTNSVIIKSKTTDSINKKSINFLSSYKANFKVLENNEKEYLVEWTYTDSNLAVGDPVFENNIIAKLLNTKIQIKLSNVGKFIELVNVEELKSASNKVLDELIKTEKNQNIKVQYNGIKQLITTKQGLEIVLLKQIKLYHFSFGYNYNLNNEKTNNIKFPNPLGGEPFEAIEKVNLTKLDNKNSICVIETSKIVDGEILTKSVLNYLKNIYKDKFKEIDAELGKSKFKITENSIQELNFEKGSLKKSYFKRIVNLGVQNRTVVFEIDAIN